jgi:DNA-binding NtrC family response regulator
MQANQILIVDDEVGIRELLSEILRDEGYGVRLAENAQAARAIRQEARPDLVLLDIWMPDTDGITLLKEWAAGGLLTMPVVMMSGHGTIDSAVEATRIGARDFLEKPISLPKLLATVSKALAAGRMLTRAGLSLAQLGKARVVQELRQRLDQVSRLRTPVLLVGEPGCGFEVAARHLRPANAPWVAPEGAEWLAANPFEPLNEARDGLLFIAELSSLNAREQRGLAQLLGKIEKLNVRLVCGASGPMTQLVRDGTFEANLFHQLSGLTIRVPSLAEHPEDVPALALSLLNAMAEANEAPFRVLAASAQNALRNLDWRGNLPVLRNTLKTLALTASGSEIAAEDVARVGREFGLVPRDQQAPGPALALDMPLREARELFERQYFLHHMRREDGNMSRVAERVGLERTHLYRKLKQLGIRPSGRTDDAASRG